MYGHLFATPIPHRLYTLEVDDIGDALAGNLSEIIEVFLSFAKAYGTAVR